jgi:hypothetical protein
LKRNTNPDSIKISLLSEISYTDGRFVVTTERGTKDIPDLSVSDRDRDLADSGDIKQSTIEESSKEQKSKITTETSHILPGPTFPPYPSWSRTPLTILRSPVAVTAANQPLNPSDCSVAVGVDDIIVVTNGSELSGSVRIYKKQDFYIHPYPAPKYANNLLIDFLNPGGKIEIIGEVIPGGLGLVGDARVYYDELSRRFLLVCMARKLPQNSGETSQYYLFLAASVTNLALGPWRVEVINVNPPSWLNSPSNPTQGQVYMTHALNLAFDNHNIYITGIREPIPQNNLPKFHYTQLFIVNKQELLSVPTHGGLQDVRIRRMELRSSISDQVAGKFLVPCYTMTYKPEDHIFYFLQLLNWKGDFERFGIWRLNNTHEVWNNDFDIDIDSWALKTNRYENPVPVKQKGTDSLVYKNVSSNLFESPPICNKLSKEHPFDLPPKIWFCFTAGRRYYVGGIPVQEPTYNHMELVIVDIEDIHSSPKVFLGGAQIYEKENHYFQPSITLDRNDTLYFVYHRCPKEGLISLDAATNFGNFTTIKTSEDSFTQSTRITDYLGICRDPSSPERDLIWIFGDYFDSAQSYKTILAPVTRQ